MIGTVPMESEKMIDLIDRQTLLNEIEQYHLSDGKFQHWVEVQPPEDAVKIVRCRDCKHNPIDTWFECPISHLPYKEDRWCWKGERKDE